jgi:hypothetical protein
VGLGITATWLFEGEERKLGIFLAVLGVLGIIVGSLGLASGGSTAAPRDTAAAPPPPPPPPSA